MFGGTDEGMGCTPWGGGVAVGRDAVSGWRVRGVRDCAKGKGGVGGDTSPEMRFAYAG